MKILVIISSILIAQTSASFFDVIQGAVLSVQNSFGKLLSDVVSDVRETVDCTILAVEHVLSLSDDATKRYYEKCGNATNTTDSVNETAQVGMPKLEVSMPFPSDDYLKKEIPAIIDARINETLTRVLGSLSYNSSDKLRTIEKELAKDTERLVDVSDLVKQEMKKVSGEVKNNMTTKKKDEKSVENILQEIKLLEKIEQDTKNISQAKEIRRVINEVAVKLDSIEDNKASKSTKLQDIFKDFENNSTSSFKGMRQQLKSWKEEEFKHLDDFKIKMQDLEKNVHHPDSHVNKLNHTQAVPLNGNIKPLKPIEENLILIEPKDGKQSTHPNKTLLLIDKSFIPSNTGNVADSNKISLPIETISTLNQPISTSNALNNVQHISVSTLNPIRNPVNVTAVTVTEITHPVNNKTTVINSEPKSLYVTPSATPRTIDSDIKVTMITSTSYTISKSIIVNKIINVVENTMTTKDKCKPITERAPVSNVVKTDSSGGKNVNNGSINTETTTKPSLKIENTTVSNTLQSTPANKNLKMLPKDQLKTTESTMRVNVSAVTKTTTSSNLNTQSTTVSNTNVLSTTQTANKNLKILPKDDPTTTENSLKNNETIIKPDLVIENTTISYTVQSTTLTAKKNSSILPKDLTTTENTLENYGSTNTETTTRPSLKIKNNTVSYTLQSTSAINNMQMLPNDQLKTTESTLRNNVSVVTETTTSSILNTEKTTVSNTVPSKTGIEKKNLKILPKDDPTTTENSLKNNGSTDTKTTTKPSLKIENTAVSNTLQSTSAIKNMQMLPNDQLKTTESTLRNNVSAVTETTTLSDLNTDNTTVSNTVPSTTPTINKSLKIWSKDDPTPTEYSLKNNGSTDTETTNKPILKIENTTVSNTLQSTPANKNWKMSKDQLKTTESTLRSNVSAVTETTIKADLVIENTTVSNTLQRTTPNSNILPQDNLRTTVNSLNNNGSTNTATTAKPSLRIDTTTLSNNLPSTLAKGNLKIVPKDNITTTENTLKNNVSNDTTVNPSLKIETSTISILVPTTVSTADKVLKILPTDLLTTTENILKNNVLADTATTTSTHLDTENTTPTIPTTDDKLKIVPTNNLTTEKSHVSAYTKTMTSPHFIAESTTVGTTTTVNKNFKMLPTDNLTTTEYTLKNNVSTVTGTTITPSLKIENPTVSNTLQNAPANENLKMLPKDQLKTTESTLRNNVSHVTETTTLSNLNTEINTVPGTNPTENKNLKMLPKDNLKTTKYTLNNNASTVTITTPKPSLKLENTTVSNTYQSMISTAVEHLKILPLDQLATLNNNRSNDTGTTLKLGLITENTPVSNNVRSTTPTTNNNVKIVPEDNLSTTENSLKKHFTNTEITTLSNSVTENATVRNSVPSTISIAVKLFEVLPADHNKDENKLKNNTLNYTNTTIASDLTTEKTTAVSNIKLTTISTTQEKLKKLPTDQRTTTENMKHNFSDGKTTLYMMAESTTARNTVHSTTLSSDVKLKILSTDPSTITIHTLKISGYTNTEKSTTFNSTTEKTNDNNPVRSTVSTSHEKLKTLPTNQQTEVKNIMMNNFTNAKVTTPSHLMAESTTTSNILQNTTSSSGEKIKIWPVDQITTTENILKANSHNTKSTTASYLNSESTTLHIVRSTTPSADDTLKILPINKLTTTEKNKVSFNTGTTTAFNSTTDNTTVSVQRTTSTSAKKLNILKNNSSSDTKTTTASDLIRENTTVSNITELSSTKNTLKDNGFSNTETTSASDLLKKNTSVDHTTDYLTTTEYNNNTTGDTSTTTSLLYLNTGRTTTMASTMIIGDKEFKVLHRDQPITTSRTVKQNFISDSNFKTSTTKPSSVLKSTTESQLIRPDKITIATTSKQVIPSNISESTPSTIRSINGTNIMDANTSVKYITASNQETSTLPAVHSTTVLNYGSSDINNIETTKIPVSTMKSSKNNKSDFVSKLKRPKKGKRKSKVVDKRVPNATGMVPSDTETSSINIGVADTPTTALNKISGEILAEESTIGYKVIPLYRSPIVTTNSPTTIPENMDSNEESSFDNTPIHASSDTTFIANDHIMHASLEKADEPLIIPAGGSGEILSQSYYSANQAETKTELLDEPVNLFKEQNSNPTIADFDYSTRRSRKSYKRNKAKRRDSEVYESRKSSKRRISDFDTTAIRRGKENGKSTRRATRRPSYREPMTSVHRVTRGITTQKPVFKRLKKYDMSAEDYDSFFNISPKNSEAHQQALTNARRIIESSNQSDQIIKNILKIKKRVGSRNIFD